VSPRFDVGVLSASITISAAARADPSLHLPTSPEIDEGEEEEGGWGG